MTSASSKDFVMGRANLGCWASDVPGVNSLIAELFEMNNTNTGDLALVGMYVFKKFSTWDQWVPLPRRWIIKPLALGPALEGMVSSTSFLLTTTSAEVTNTSVGTVERGSGSTDPLEEYGGWYLKTVCVECCHMSPGTSPVGWDSTTWQQSSSNLG